MEEAKKNGIEYYELPVAFDALTVVVNKANPLNEISVADLKKMWAPESQGKVMKWSDVNSSWPGTSLTLFGPGADSGTFDYFTEAIVGKSKSSRGDFTASEDDNVLVQGVARDPQPASGDSGRPRAIARRAGIAQAVSELAAVERTRAASAVASRSRAAVGGGVRSCLRWERRSERQARKGRTSAPGF
jgi:hypothetical protein